MSAEVQGFQVQGMDRSKAVRLMFSLMGIFFGGLVALMLGLALGVRGPDIALLAWAIATVCVCALPLALDQVRPRAKRHVIFSMLSLCYALRFVLPILTFYIPAIGPVDPPGTFLLHEALLMHSRDLDGNGQELQPCGPLSA
jgi:hypothetical protein